VLQQQPSATGSLVVSQHLGVDGSVQSAAQYTQESTMTMHRERHSQVTPCLLAVPAQVSYWNTSRSQRGSMRTGTASWALCC